jgi:hypothetical protein
MSARWDAMLVEARPPSRPRRLDVGRIAVWIVMPLLAWVVIILGIILTLRWVW